MRWGTDSIDAGRIALFLHHQSVVGRHRSVTHDVRFWHKADIPVAPGNVRFRGYAGRRTADAPVMPDLTRLLTLCATHESGWVADG
jgi:hypothetical protein